MRIQSLLKLLILPAGLTLLSCQWDGGPGRLDQNVYRSLAALYGKHPRLLVEKAAEQSLRNSLNSTHRWLWERYLQDLPAKIRQAERLPETLDRGHGNLAADLAFAWRATGSDSLFTTASDYLLRLCQREVWDPEYDLLHGHLLLGAAIAYDWLQPSLSRSQRTLIADKLGDEAEMQYRRITEKRAWYRNEYLQNHAHVNYAGLAYAAVALYGEDARAQDWLAACEEFFGRVFAASPSDGTSIEGLSYGNYAMEFCLFYAELARTVFGKNYFDSPWIANYPQYVLHSLLPSPREEEWAMTFGDSPRHGNSHGPEPQLFLIASRLGNPAAQWLGKRLIELRQEGLASASWWSLIWYDPTVAISAPESFPELKEFPAIGQVMARSSWVDTLAMLVGIKCGPFLGAGADTFGFDLGAAHGHPDAGSFQLYSRGRFALIDPGYTYFKRTANHNTLLVKGRGQLGEDEPWFAAAEALKFGHHPRIVETRADPRYHYVLADLAGAYHPALGLHKALRHLLFLKPDLLLVVDELTLDDRGILFSYPADTLETEGPLKLEGGYLTGTRGRASFSFEGPPGQYSLAVSYIDNAPETGSYSVLVDSDTAHTWQDTVEITDTHLELVPQVKLITGSRVTFNADPMGEGARLVKLMVYSPDIPAAREANWLLNFEPSARLERVFASIEAKLDGLTLDVYPLAPVQRNHDWGLHPVKTGSQYTQTMQLVIRPVFTDSSVTLVNFLHLRAGEAPALEWLRGELAGSLAQVRWYERGQPRSVTLDLQSHKVTILP